MFSKNYFVSSNLFAKMSLYESFFITKTKTGIWKALMPSIRSHPEGPKYGNKLTLYTQGGIKIIWTYSLPPPPLPHMLQFLPGFLLLPQKNLCVTLNLFLFLLNLLTNLFLRKENYNTDNNNNGNTLIIIIMLMKCK
jgi:hypothetical protein